MRLDMKLVYFIKIYSW